MKPSLPLMAFIGCALIWGSTFLVIRVGNDALPALWACSLRLGLAGLLLCAILVVTRQSFPMGPALRAAALYGLWEFGIGLPLLYWGERSVPSGLAAVLYATCPLAASLEASALGMERLNPRKLTAAALALAGVALIFWGGLSRGASGSGLLSVFISACAAPMAALALQRGPQQGAIGANAVGALAGIPTCLIASFALGEKHAIPLSRREIFPVVYLAVAGSTIAFVLFAWLLRHWRTSSAAFLGVVIPVIAVILGSVVRQEPLGLFGLAGGAIVIASVWTALRSDRQITAAD